MIAAWMLYCALCALGLSIAALLAERVLLAARRAVRFVWFGALLLSFVLPFLAFRLAPRAVVLTSRTDEAQAARSRVAAPQSPRVAAAQSPYVAGIDQPGLVESYTVRSRPEWRAIGSRIDQPLALGWFVLSL